MKKKLLDRRGAAIELAIMMMVFSIFITTILLTTALLQNDHKAKAELGVRQDILLEQLGEDFVEAVLKGEIGAEWKPSYDGIAIENTSVERHQWVEGDPVEATCEEDGYTPYTCTLCGETEKVKKEFALGHAISMPLVIEPSCSTTGKEMGECSRCGQPNAVNLKSAYGHRWEKDEEKPATCAAEGNIKYLCKNANCNEGYTVTIPKLLEHILYEKTQLTTTNGCERTVLYGCSQEGCEAYETEITTSNHENSQKILESSPTCTEEGVQTLYCKDCKKKYDVIIPANGHNWGHGVEIESPKCTTAGVKEYTCSICGDTKNEKIEAKKHNFNEAGQCAVCGLKTAYTLTVIAVERDSYKIEVLERAPEAEPCETAVLQIVLEWSAEDNAYKITEWSKK